jgi:hypothetical protein
MKILYLIIAGGFILYKTHITARLLEALRLPEDPEAAEAPEVDETPTRPQLEAHAIYILESRGLSTDYVKYMSNRLLAEIIEGHYTSR